MVQEGTGAGEGITDPQADSMYAAIRRMRADVRRDSQATGVPEDVVRSVRRHLFLDTHEIAVAPNETVRMRFTADPKIAELWTRAAGRGALLTADEVTSHKRIMAHEYVERAMMRHGGMPYRSTDPAAWQHIGGEWEYRPMPEALGAHDMAPLADWQSPPWRHYPALGLGQPAEG